MANTKKTTTKKTVTKKATPKKKECLTVEDKKIVWLAITVMVALAAYFVLTFFA